MKGITSMLASAAVAAMRYSSTSWLKLQYQLTGTEKDTELKKVVFGMNDDGVGV